jgi:cell division protein FtsW
VLKRLEQYDFIILLMVLALTCFGIVMVYSASSVMAAKKYDNSAHFLVRQSIFALVGLTAMIWGMATDYQFWRKHAVVILLGCMAALIIVLIPGIGSAAGGASRWIKLPGFNLQPSEPAKIAFIMYMAYSLDRKQDKVQFFSTGFLPYMVVLAIILALLLKQPDLGASITLGCVALVMLFAAGTRATYIVSMVLLALPFLYFLVMKVDYRRRRLTAFMDPFSDPTNSGFQIIQSWIGFGNGGILGQGLGEGKQKMFFLPEAHTDFIGSVLGEELGFFGVMVIASMFLLLIMRGIRIALAAEDTFGRFLAFGITTLLGLEAFINMAVITGLLPTKGLALPFISYGGSSLVISMFAVGILLNISSKARGPI